ncbi:hypothetical protein PHAVU_004G124000 [Phaseolus vulgaris]|uniref:Protein kinase domain-containing protein n=1 Tax=Phaseolus vulgaris TaxID=3885 RepID=V7C501_PHAVU|nr:hypothetical protein PHAVU_004G124000g [Phaseolus vulgaris]ESW24360.1 hypothetical protein PHAVU_004G124000g [Phaseolus vulgaris]
MGDKGDTTKKQQQQQPQSHLHHQHQQQQQQTQQISSSPKAPREEAITEVRPIHHHQQLSSVVVVTGAPPFISSPLYVSSGASSSPYEPQFETLNPKRPRYSGQWKQLLPSPPSQPKQSQMAMLPTTESSPSPTTHTSSNPQQPQTQTVSSSDTSSSPTHSLPLPSGGSGQEGSNQEGEQVHQQLRKGKYVSPVWKPNEMLWLARAWKEQYQGGGGGGGGGSESSSRAEQQQQAELGITRGKTRADKDKEVAEFLKRHGVNRDAKTAGTKWDNMLGEFRKVYEWERGGEREQIGKSYFRLSPYERKLHRLPASFDEDVFEELAQFMGSRMRSSHGRAGSSFVSGDEARTALAAARALPPPPRPFKDDEIPLSATTKQLAITSGSEPFFQGSRGVLLGLDTLLDVSGSSSSKELRRIGKIRMTWEESVSLWAEEGEIHRGRVRLQSSSFLNADELTCFDDAMVPCPMEYFEDGPLKGFSVDRFVSGQQVKVFGRRKSSPASDSSGFAERVQLPSKALPIRSIATLDFRDPTEYYMECLLRASPQTLPSLYELKRHLQEPPPEDLRFPLRRDVYEELPQGKELFFTTTPEPLDCRTIMYDIVGPIIRTSNPSLSLATSSSRDSFIPLWDECINRVIQKFCPEELVLIRKPTSPPPESTTQLQDQWPNVTGFVNNYCLWRGEETHQLKESQPNPSTTLVGKLLWTYMDLPYILGYHAVANTVTFCALSRSQDGIINRTDLHEVNLTTPVEKLKALVPCFRIGLLLALLSKRCASISNCKGFTYSDFERVCYGNGVVTEVTPTTCMRVFMEKRKWMAVKEVYEILDHRIPHAEVLVGFSERELALSFKPRGCRVKPGNCEELVEALKFVTKAMVALHDLSFMHRDLKWEKVMRRRDREEWFVCGFDEAAGAPELKGHVSGARGSHAPEMERGLHGVKVDVWGVGNLIRTCGLGGVPKMLRELQNRCMEQNPEQRPTAADCYHHLLQLQSSLSAAAGGVVMM